MPDRYKCPRCGYHDDAVKTWTEEESAPAAEAVTDGKPTSDAPVFPTPPVPPVTTPKAEEVLHSAE